MYKTQRFKKMVWFSNFFFRKSMTSVFNGMLLKFFLNKFSFLSSIAILKLVFLPFLDKFNHRVPKHGDFWISMFQYMEIQKFLWFKHGDFSIFVFQYMEIKKSPCIKTWRFCKAKLFIFSNLRVSNHGDSEISVYKTHKFLNFRVSIHGDLKISLYWNMEIQKLSCFIHADFFYKANNSVKSKQMMKIF